MQGKEDRQRAQEAKFASDEEARFKREMADVRAFAAWAAGTLGKGGEASGEIVTAFTDRMLSGGKPAVLAHALEILGHAAPEAEVRRRAEAIGKTA